MPMANRSLFRGDGMTWNIFWISLSFKIAACPAIERNLSSEIYRSVYGGMFFDASGEGRYAMHSSSS